jgi:hypothetical protein
MDDIKLKLMQNADLIGRARCALLDQEEVNLKRQLNVEHDRKFKDQWPTSSAAEISARKTAMDAITKIQEDLQRKIDALKSDVEMAEIQLDAELESLTSRITKFVEGRKEGVTKKTADFIDHVMKLTSEQAQELNDRGSTTYTLDGKVIEVKRLE